MGTKGNIKKKSFWGGGGKRAVKQKSGDKSVGEMEWGGRRSNQEDLKKKSKALVSM